jgi:osmotically-inducible protein OsmY
VAPERRPDREIHAELLAHFRADPLFNDDDIQVRVRDGQVALTGSVDTAREKNWAREDAWIRGVRQVNVDELAIEPDLTLSTVQPQPAPVDSDIRHTLTRNYANDPRVASMNLNVSVEKGVVTLEGAVANLRARRAALRIARTTGGVVQVVDRLRLESGASREDGEIAGSIRAALRTSAALARNAIDVTVTNGRATLTGTVDSAYERWLVGDLAGRVAGVSELENNTEIRGAIGGGARTEYFPREGAASPWTTGETPPAAPER